MNSANQLAQGLLRIVLGLGTDYLYPNPGPHTISLGIQDFEMHKFWLSHAFPLSNPSSVNNSFVYGEHIPCSLWESYFSPVLYFKVGVWLWPAKSKYYTTCAIVIGSWMGTWPKPGQSGPFLGPFLKLQRLRYFLFPWQHAESAISLELNRPLLTTYWKSLLSNEGNTKEIKPRYGGKANSDHII